MPWILFTFYLIIILTLGTSSILKSPNRLKKEEKGYDIEIG